MNKIYVLRCNDNKYYVGKTIDVDRRFAEHLAGDRGSEWTRRYAPLEVIDVQPMTSDMQEMNVTLEYMKQYGIDNVRGAQWVHMTLTDEERSTIRKAIHPNACYRCGQNGHFANRCTQRNPQTSQWLNDDGYDYYNTQDLRYAEQMRCDRCGRTSHHTRDCYATVDINNSILECARCGRGSHTARDCYARTDVDGTRLY